MCSVFVLVRIRGDAEPLQDAREALVSAWLVHLAPEAKRRDFMSSCPHHRECVMVSVDSSPLKHVVIRNRFWRFASDLLPKCYKIEKNDFGSPHGLATLCRMSAPRFCFFLQNCKMPIDKLARREYNECIHHEGGAVMTVEKSYFYFFYFAEGCPSFVSSDI